MVAASIVAHWIKSIEEFHVIASLNNIFCQWDLSMASTSCSTTHWQLSGVARLTAYASWSQNGLRVRDIISSDGLKVVRNKNCEFCKKSRVGRAERNFRIRTKAGVRPKQIPQPEEKSE
jgi:hypothetical protein